MQMKSIKEDSSFQQKGFCPCAPHTIHKDNREKKLFGNPNSHPRSFINLFGLKKSTPRPICKTSLKQKPNQKLQPKNLHPLLEKIAQNVQFQTPEKTSLSHTHKTGRFKTQPATNIQTTQFFNSNKPIKFTYQPNQFRSLQQNNYKQILGSPQKPCCTKLSFISSPKANPSYYSNQTRVDLAKFQDQSARTVTLQTEKRESFSDKIQPLAIRSIQQIDYCGSDRPKQSGFHSTRQELIRNSYTTPTGSPSKRKRIVPRTIRSEFQSEEDNSSARYSIVLISSPKKTLRKLVDRNQFQYLENDYLLQ